MKTSYLIAGAIALATLAWIGSGYLFPSGEKSANGEAAAMTSAGDAASAPASPESAAETPLVGIFESVAQIRSRALTLRGRTEADRMVVVSAETSGRIEEIFAEKGLPVKTGDPILRIDGADREARLAEAKALLAQRQAELKASAALEAKGYTPKLNMADLRAKLALAEAELTGMEVEIAHLTVQAPIDGILDQRPAERGSYLQIGTPIATIVDLDPILLVGSVAEQDLGRLKIGDTASARLIDGREITGKVRFIAATAEETTRTFRIEIAAANPDYAVRQGISAEISIPIEERPAHRISPAILTLAEDGAIGVKSVADDGTVVFHAIDILGEDAEGLWVAGLPDRLRLIVRGQEFVKAGQRVRAQAIVP